MVKFDVSPTKEEAAGMAHGDLKVRNAANAAHAARVNKYQCRECGTRYATQEDLEGHLLHLHGEYPGGEDRA